jgi:tol-pal system protein YbgF
MRLRFAFALALLALPLWAGGARAALFDDDEARRRVNELRASVEAEQKALDVRLVKIEAAVRDRAVDLSQLIDGLKQDIAKLRGQVELLINQAETLDRRQKDLYVDLDTRLRKLEQGPPPAEKPAQPAAADPAAESKTYEAALNQFKLGNYQSAIAAFQLFMTNYPQSQLVSNAQYWIGNAYYQLRDYKVAIATQQKLLSAWPTSSKASDALFNIASCQNELGDARAARETLQGLIKKYPGTSAAEQAKQRLAKR